MFTSYRTRPRGVLAAHSFASDLSREMDRLVSSLAQDAVPKVSPFQDEGDFLVFSIPTPGFSDADLEITATPDELQVTGKRTEKELEGYSARHRERGALNFSQKHPLPCRVNADEIRATLRDGVLRIELPKTGEEARRTIQIGAKKRDQN